MNHMPELVAAAWTLAGNLSFPPGPDERSKFSFEERASAAVRAGYCGMGVTHFDLLNDVAEYGYPRLRRIIQDTGLRRLEFDAIHSWFGEDAASGQALATSMLQAAGELGADVVKIVGSLDGSTRPIEELRDNFAVIAEQAKSVDTMLGLEIMPQSNICDVQSALDVIGDAPNAGLTLDIWHVTRRGIAYESLKSIPVHRIASVELNDGAAEPQGDFLYDMTNHRQLCGTGSFDIAGYLDAIMSTGYSGYYSVEILSGELRALPLDVMASLSFRHTMTAFDTL
ncbi:MAG: sugar phosphate isomerase/epimerase family protein [Sphingobium sp.]